MIQLIEYSSIASKITSDEIENTLLNKPKSFYGFDINIIDLSDEDIWKYNEQSVDTVNCLDDLISLSEIIKNSRDKKVVIILPQNISYKYYYEPYNRKFMKSKQLKNMLPSFVQMILEALNINLGNLIYEINETIINEIPLKSDFYFETSEKVLTKASKSKRTTTIEKNNIIVTTLEFVDSDGLICFLNEVGLINNKDQVPIWIKELYMFDDEKQNENINHNKELIERANKLIKESQAIIDKNNEYKSILYTNSNQLVKVVFEILEELLKCDLSDFKDEKKEDFLIGKNEITFIGEIKGVTSNIRSEHISQLDVHLQGYKDKLQEENKVENVKSILIINHQRNKRLEERQPVHKNQIDLAKRNDSLIIETITLLNIFEKFKNGQITSEEIQDKFINLKGLLCISDFDIK